MGARRHLACAVLALAAAWPLSRALAAPFPTRQGEVGILDVPTADVSGRGGGLIGGELRLDKASGQPTSVGPLPLSLTFGLGENLDGGFAMREGGFPGDPRPSPLLFGGALKYRLVGASGLWPALAVDATLDRANGSGVLGTRLIASTAEVGRLRFSAYAGAEGHGPKPYEIGPTGGLAVALLHRSDLETVLEGVAGPRGPMVAGAFRWSLHPKLGVSFGLAYLPRESGVRVSLGFGLAAAAPQRRRSYQAAPVEKGPAVAEAPRAPAGPVFLDDRPRLRMRIRSAALAEGTRHLQYGPFSDPLRSSPTARPAAVKASDADALRAQELASLAETLDGRERRLKSAEAALLARAEQLAADRERLPPREKELQARAQRLEERERALRGAGKSAEAELRLAETEERFREEEARRAGAESALREEAARLAARERELRSREEQAAQASEQAVRADAPLDARARAAEARQAALAAFEARLSGTRNRLDVIEKAIDAQQARLEMTERRLAAKEERITLVERRMRSRAGTAAPGAARPAALPALSMVVKSPTAILRAAPAAKGTAAGSARGMSAATVVAFATPDQGMSDRDRDAVEDMARLAAKENVELLVWARAQNPGLMEAAARKAESVKAVAAAAGARQVNTRVTLRPSTTGIDVVVSAMREQAAAPAEAGAHALAEGETGKRQIREAAVLVRGDIEACVQPELARLQLDRAELVLKLVVGASGNVEKVGTAGLTGGGDMDPCVARAAKGWRFPSSEGGYSTEVPLSVVRGGGAR